jgi:nitroreductase
MLETFLARRSIRKYTGEPVTHEALDRIMRAAMSTPSACDCRPWEFVVVRDAAKKKELAGLGMYTGMAAGADLLIFVCAVPERQAICPGFFPQDCGAVCQSILLQVTAEGLGAVWCGIYPKEEMVEKTARALGTPEGVIPLAMICIGNPAEHPAPRDRYEEARIHHENW